MTERTPKPHARAPRDRGGRSAAVPPASRGPRKPAGPVQEPHGGGHDGVEAHKAKLLRDSFTIPETEYEVLAMLKERATHLRRPAKKSELLRAGIAALRAMSDKAFLAILDQVPSLKTGRPKTRGARKGEDRN